MSNQTGNYVLAFSTVTAERYLVVINLKGYVSKSYEVSTENIPKASRGTEFPLIQNDISLFKPVEGVDYSELKGPLIKYFYDKKLDNYTYDKAHLAQSIKKMEKIKQLEEAAMKKGTK